MENSDMQYIGLLIDVFYRFADLRKVAVKTNADEVVGAIDEQMKRIKVKLQPLELPED